MHNSPLPIFVPVGNTHTPSQVHEVRSRAQRETVLSIVNSPDFDFACGNPLSSMGSHYTGPFVFSYFTKDGAFRSTYIERGGVVVHEYSS